MARRFCVGYEDDPVAKKEVGERANRHGHQVGDDRIDPPKPGQKAGRKQVSTDRYQAVRQVKARERGSSVGCATSVGPGPSPVPEEVVKDRCLH